MSAASGWPWPRVLAHRGGGTLAPENTLAGIDAGLAWGFRAIEFDVMLAGDGVPVAIHDDTLERTTDGTGPVPAQPAAALGRLDAGRWRSPRFAGARIPTLARVLASCRDRGIWMNVEIKPYPGQERRTGEVVAAQVAAAFADVAAHGPAALPLLSSFSGTALAAAREVAPHLPRGHLFEQVPADWAARLAALDCVALHAHHRDVTPTLAGAVKAAGLGLFCYTVNDPARARTLFGWGVDALCTDRLDQVPPDLAG